MNYSNYSDKINNTFQDIAFNKNRVLSRVAHPENVIKYWHIGKFIYEILQEEKDRAEYGTYLIKFLSRKLKFEIGRGFSERRLKDMRKLYLAFPEIKSIDPRLGWTQLRIIMGIDSREERDFYINICIKEKTSTRTLERLIRDHTYEQAINR